MAISSRELGSQLHIWKTKTLVKEIDEKILEVKQSIEHVHGKLQGIYNDAKQFDNYFSSGKERSDLPRKPEDVDGRWISMHNSFIEISKKKNAKVVLIGDFIVGCLAAYTKIWEEYFKPFDVINFGINEDCTENVLWRLRNGAIDTVDPKVIVLSVGGNNICNDSDDILNGIKSCVECIMEKKPRVNLIVLKLLPCGQRPNILRDVFDQVNQNIHKIIEKYPSAEIIDFDTGFIMENGDISRRHLYNYKYLTEFSYITPCTLLKDIFRKNLGKLVFN